MREKFALWVGLLPLITLLAASLAFANGGPFVMHYPGGDTAAKGTVATIDPDLKPAREKRLKVVKEDLTIAFLPANRIPPSNLPLAHVRVVYQIENPTGKEIEIDFGFPILRGFYISPVSMVPTPDVQVQLDDGWLRADVISTSAIYGIIRDRARKTIDSGIAARPDLAKLVGAVRGSDAPGREKARSALLNHLVKQRKWDVRDAALMVEYASNRFQEPWDVIVVNAYGDYTSATWPRDRTPSQMAHSNLGPLRAIGEQKATQFFAQLAEVFDPAAPKSYEAIFAAWGGDVRERALDIRAGKMRPREYSVPQETDPPSLPNDPTIYARVDYLDASANISPEEKLSCQNVLKNLDVIFTFAPMNILHYKAVFPPKSIRTLSVTYKQIAFEDSREPRSYQLAYVVHPASFWDSFGPIHLEFFTPEGITALASVPTTSAASQQVNWNEVFGSTLHVMLTPTTAPLRFSPHSAVLPSKKGELTLAVDAEAWDKAFPSNDPNAPVVVVPTPSR